VLGGLGESHTKYGSVTARPVYLDWRQADPKRPERAGAGLAAWSNCGRYLATKCEGLPSVVWVWDLPSVSLAALLVHTSPVRAAGWDPAGPRLALLTGGAAIYIWTPVGGAVAAVPSVARREVEGLTGLEWGSRGGLALHSNRHTVLVSLEGAAEADSELDLEPSREESTS